MYILNKPVAILGAVITALSTVLCPFLKVPIIGNWNLYQTDLRLFFITIGLLAIVVFTFFIRSIRWYKISSTVFVIWCLLGLAAVYFQINNYFGVKFIDGLLSKTLHIKWGWLVLIVGAVLMRLSVRKLKEVK